MKKILVSIVAALMAVPSFAQFSSGGFDLDKESLYYGVRFGGTLASINGDISIGYVVINVNGIVGKIINVSKNTSDVKLLISLNNEKCMSTSFNYENNEYYGLIDNDDIIKNELTIKNVLGELNIQKIKYLNVVISWLNDSFSSSLLMGKIKTLKKDDFRYSNNIIITPIVEFDNLE